MCHGEPSESFPTPEVTGEIHAEVAALTFGRESAEKRIAILPDIYGLNQFYRGLSTYLSGKACQVFLVNPFDGLDPLPKVTRDAAFARRSNVADRDFVDRFEAFCGSHRIDGVVGFCLGGLYVFELARREVAQNLVGFYGFPQGMQNIDPLPVPFDYLGTLTKPHACLMPGQDASVGIENIERLAKIAETKESLRLRLYPESGHGFLTDLDSDDAQLKANAVDALTHCECVLGL